MDIDGGSGSSSSKAKVNNALPDFFSSAATSSEAAKYHKSSQRSRSSSGYPSTVSQSAKYLQSLSMPQPPGDTAASLFPHVSTSSASDGNNNFSILEERIPFSSSSNAPIPPLFDGDSGMHNNIFDLLFAVEMSTENAENNNKAVRLSPVDTAMRKSEPGTTDITFDVDDFEEPEFFIGSGTDIE